MTLGSRAQLERDRKALLGLWSHCPKPRKMADILLAGGEDLAASVEDMVSRGDLIRYQGADGVLYDRPSSALSPHPA